MTAIDFPNSPTLNQTFSASNRTWKWNGTTWGTVASTTIAPTAHASSHAAAGADAVTLAQSQVTNLTTDLAAKASTTDLATKASLTGAETLTNKTLSAPLFSAGAREVVNIVNGGLNNYGAAWSDTAGVWYYTQSSGPWSTFNVTNSTSNLLSTMSIGQSITQVVLLTQTGTGYLPTTFTVDGGAATIKWMNGSAPTPGTNAIDVLTVTLIKTGTSTFILLGSVSKFA